MLCVVAFGSANYGPVFHYDLFTLFYRRKLPALLVGNALAPLMQAPLELVSLGSSSSMDSFASWKMNGSGMKKGGERGDATSRRR